MDYDTLAKTIRAYSENDFPDTEGSGGLTSTEQIDTFIQQAEQRIYNTIQFLELRKNVTAPIVAGVQYIGVPDDWLANFSLARIDSLGGYTYLLNKDVNYIREAFPFPPVSGPPTHYCYFDQKTYLLGPTPDDNYTLELHYFFYPESIVTAGATWLGDHFDTILLYGAMLEAGAYMKSEADVMTQYQTRYDQALAMAKQYAEGKTREDNYRVQQVRYPVR